MQTKDPSLTFLSLRPAFFFHAILHYVRVSLITRFIIVNNQ